MLPSLAVTVDWLRRCVREAPTLRMQVLVTGSLYLVGDLLKMLQPQQQAAEAAGGAKLGNSSGSSNGMGSRSRGSGSL